MRGLLLLDLVEVITFILWATRRIISWTLKDSYIPGLARYDNEAECKKIGHIISARFDNVPANRMFT